MKVSTYRFTNIAENGGSVRNFKLPALCGIVRSVIFFFEEKVAQNINCGTVSLLLNDKSDNVISDLPINFYNNDFTLSQHIRNGEIQLNTPVNSKTNNTVVFKNSDALNALIAAGTVSTALTLVLMVNYE